MHKDSVWACGRVDGRVSVEKFGTTTGELLRLGDWLAEAGVTVVAMESTGVYWKPVWNLPEGRPKLMPVNAQHVKQVPGRGSTAFGSDFGELDSTELAEVSRAEAQARRELAEVKTGREGPAVDRPVAPARPAQAELRAPTGRRMRPKVAALTEALTRRVTGHHRFMLEALLGQVEHLEEQVGAFDRRTEQVTAPFEREAARRLDGIPGVNARRSCRPASDA